MPGNDKPACKTFRKEVSVLDKVVQKTLRGGSLMRIYKEIQYVCDECGLKSPDFRALRYHTFEGRVINTQE